MRSWSGVLWKSISLYRAIATRRSERSADRHKALHKAGARSAQLISPAEKETTQRLSFYLCYLKFVIAAVVHLFYGSA